MDTTDTTMADEFYERYRRQTHQELYRMLHNGSAPQVAKVADTWASIADTLATLAAGLRRDLERLQPDWTGRGSREFHYRLDLVSRYAQTLADEAASIRGGLTAMSHALREAQLRADTPDLAFTRDASPSSDGVLRSELGRVLPAGEQASAHERMVQVVAQLAADYGVADHGNWPVAMPDAPLDLPAVDTPVQLATSALEQHSGGTTLAGAVSLTPAGRTGTPADAVTAAAAATAAASMPGGGVAPAARVETLRGGYSPAHVVGLNDPGTARPSGLAAAGPAAAGPVTAGAATAPGAAAPMAPLGMGHPGPVGSVPVGSVPADAAAWRSADNLDWAEDDSETPPGVLGD